MPTKFSALIAVVVALLVLPFSAGVASAQKRVALVIGNGVYQNVARLANPINDATAVAQMFKNAGFDSVTMRRDLGVLDFKRALREFLDAAQDADIAVMYFAGHGIQVGDMNYMIPVDAKLATENDVQDETVSLDRIMMSLAPAKRLRLVLLDSCRENPFLNRMKVSRATRALGRGLARVEPENNTLVAYAAKGGQIAADGAGEHSPFTSALLKHLAQPGLDVRLALGRVRDEVLKNTGNRQEPFVYGSLGGESISLVPAVPSTPDALTDIKGDYELVERIGTRKAWEAFLASHKDGLYAELARAQLAKLTQGGSKATTPTDTGNSNAGLAPIELTPPPRPSVGPSRDRLDWDLIRDSGDRAKLRDFIAKYPSSPFAETARNRLEALDRAAQERDDKARAELEAARRAEEARRLEAEAAARRRAEEQARLTKPADEARPRTDESCGRDEQKLNLLRPYATQGWAREDLKRLERSTACDRIRAEVTTLLGQSGADLGQRAVSPQQMRVTPPPSRPQQQSANALDPVLAAIGELRRLGCFAEYKDPTVAEAIAQAIRRYLAEKDRPAEDVKAVENLLAELKVENERLCAKAQAKSREASRAKTTRSIMAHSEAAAPAPPKGVGVGF
jgi:Caspase domain